MCEEMSSGYVLRFKSGSKGCGILNGLGITIIFLAHNLDGLIACLGGVVSRQNEEFVFGEML